MFIKQIFALKASQAIIQVKTENFKGLPCLHHLPDPDLWKCKNKVIHIFNYASFHEIVLSKWQCNFICY